MYVPSLPVLKTADEVRTGAICLEEFVKGTLTRLSVVLRLTLYQDLPSPGSAVYAASITVRGLT